MAVLTFLASEHTLRDREAAAAWMLPDCRIHKLNGVGA